MHPFEDLEEKIPVLDVRIVETETTRELSAEFGAWQTYVFDGTEIAPVQLLPQAEKRDRAVIVVQGANVSVIVGALGQVSNGQGGQLIAPVSVIVESQSEVYCLPIPGDAVTVTVLDERYR